MNSVSIIQKDVIISLSKFAEVRDQITGSHLERVNTFCRLLAESIKNMNSEYSTLLTDDYIDQLAYASMMHDIGKIAVPDKILCKSGALTEEEYEEMKNHIYLGEAMILNISSVIVKHSLLDMILDIIRYHHENFDGSGYTRGLKKNEIPLSAAIVAVADVYDAIRSKRPYKPAYSHKYAYDFIMEQKGKKFFPIIVDAFANVENEIEEIYTL